MLYILYLLKISDSDETQPPSPGSKTQPPSPGITFSEQPAFTKDSSTSLRTDRAKSLLEARESIPATETTASSTIEGTLKTVRPTVPSHESSEFDETNVESQMLSLTDIYALNIPPYESELQLGTELKINIDTVLPSGFDQLGSDLPTGIDTQFQHYIYDSKSLQLDSVPSTQGVKGVKKIKLTNTDQASQTFYSGEILCKSSNIYTGCTCSLLEGSYMTQTLISGNFGLLFPQ